MSPNNGSILCVRIIFHFSSVTVRPFLFFITRVQEVDRLLSGPFSFFSPRILHCSPISRKVGFGLSPGSKGVGPESNSPSL